MDLGLKGKVALVVAASKGMGKASAMGFAAEGARVTMCSRWEADLTAAAVNPWAARRTSAGPRPMASMISTMPLLAATTSATLPLSPRSTKPSVQGICL